MLNNPKGIHKVTWSAKLLGKIRSFIPVSGFLFQRPIVIFQSDDWGRVGLRDMEGYERLREAGINLGERHYDLYSLETAEDVGQLASTLRKHRDSVGRSPCVEMNFVLGNLDFGRMESEGWQRIRILPLSEGLPAGWRRPGLYDSYHTGIAERVFQPALHGITHFCQRDVERNLETGGDRAELLKTLWRAGTPYIHWRMPWIGYEYWGPENLPDRRFLPADAQKQLIGEAVGAFAKMFAHLPTSGCAPGYRANQDTVKAWAQHGIKVAQNGPGLPHPPYLDGDEVLQVSRTIEFEPAVDGNFSLQASVHTAKDCFSKGIPVVVSVHSINFHSSVRNFREQTIRHLDEFLTILESEHRDLLYLHDGDLYELVQRGTYDSQHGAVRVEVLKKTFTRSQFSAKRAS